MNNNYEKDELTQSTVIAIAKQENKLLAAMLSNQAEPVWIKSSQPGDTNWLRFAQQITGTHEDGDNKIVIAGFDSSNIIFYNIEAPTVKDEEFAAIVRLQTETRLPLPAEQIEFAWRKGESKNGLTSVTVAAAKKQQLQNFVNDIGGVKPEKIILDCQAIVQVWRKFFGGTEKTALVLNAARHNTQVCLAEKGRFVNAVNLDAGEEDFSTEQSEITHRFIQDITCAIEMFGLASAANLPIFLLTDGRETINQMANCLASAGLNAKAVLPKADVITAGQISDKEIYEYRVPIGLAAIAIEDRPDEINIFKNLYAAKPKREKYSLLSPLYAGAAAATAMALFIIVLYLTDITSLNSLERKMQSTKAGISIQTLAEKQELVKSAALQRPDFLKLFTDISADKNDGIKLNMFDFKKGRLITISGTAKKDEQLYKFQKNLQNKKGITEVKIQNANKDAKTGEIVFNITFHYRNFTKKGIESRVF